MTKFLVYADVILLVLGLLVFAVWKITYNKYKKVKKECEDLTLMNESYKKMQETQTKERIEIEKGLQDAVGTGNTDSFNASIHLMQKLNDKGKSRS